MTESQAAYQQEPFAPVPLWALQQALADHKARCGKCAGQTYGKCFDDYYRRGLDKWIALAKVPNRDVI